MFVERNSVTNSATNAIDFHQSDARTGVFAGDDCSVRAGLQINLQRRLSIICRRQTRCCNFWCISIASPACVGSDNLTAKIQVKTGILKRTRNACRRQRRAEGFNHNGLATVRNNKPAN